MILLKVTIHAQFKKRDLTAEQWTYFLLKYQKESTHSFYMLLITHLLISGMQCICSPSIIPVLRLQTAQKITSS